MAGVAVVSADYGRSSDEWKIETPGRSIPWASQGYATLGQIGFSERSGYTAIGTVCNLAARLCAEAKDGQILVSSRVAGAVETVASLEDLDNPELKG